MNQEFWEEFWDKHISEADNNYRATGRGSSPEIEFFWTVHHVAMVLELRQFEYLLDIGCGTGVMSLLLSPMVGTIDAFDISEVALERASKNLDGVYNVILNVSSITDILTAPKCYHKVLAYSVLQYLDTWRDVRKALEEVYRVLKGGGKALLAANPDIGRYSDYIRKVGDTQAETDFQRKLIWFDPVDLAGVARKVGFSKAEIIPIPPRIWQSFYMFDLLVEK